jgi:hypothetical protein
VKEQENMPPATIEFPDDPMLQEIHELHHKQEWEWRGMTLEQVMQDVNERVQRFKAASNLGGKKSP